jgi:putative ABC transport system substrate-binding protein
MSDKKYLSNRRHLFVILIVVFVLTLNPATGNNLKAADKPLIAILSTQESAQYLKVIESFEQQVNSQFPEVKFARYFLHKKKRENDKISQEINKKSPALLFTLGSKATDLGLKSNTGIPLVATMILNGQAIIQSDRATGVLLTYPPEVHIEWLRRFIPTANSALVLYNPEENEEWAEEIRKQAAKKDFIIETMPVESVKELPPVLKSLGRKGTTLLGIHDKIVYSRKTAKAVLLATLRNRIPFAGISPSWVKAGALYSLSWDYTDLGRQCASVAGKILSGIPAADITPTTPDKINYVVNMKTADHLKLEIDPALIEGASKVYR